MVNDPGVAPTTRIRTYIVDDENNETLVGDEYNIPANKYPSGRFDGIRFDVGAGNNTKPDALYIDDLTIRPLSFVQSEWQN